MQTKIQKNKKIYLYNEIHLRNNDIYLCRITTIPMSFEVLLKGQIEYFRDQGYEVYTVCGEGEGKIDERNHKYLPLNREINPWKDLKALWILYLYLKKIKPTIVHTHTPKAGLIGMLASILALVPIRLHTVAGLPEMETKGFTRKILRLTEFITGICSTKVYPNSKALLDYMKKHHYISPSKLKVIGNGSSNGLDTDYFNVTDEIKSKAKELRELNGISKHSIVFVFIGRLDDHKGLRELQKAYSVVQGKYKDSWLLLVGPVEETRGGLNMDTWLAFNRHPQVITPGYQDDVRPWFAASDVLVFPSYREGFPNVPLQAAAMGLPAIVTDINGCNEIVQNGVNGLLIPKKSVNALIDKMLQMIEHPEDRLRMAKTARSLVVEKYNQVEVWRAIENEYQFWLRQKKLI